MKFWMSAFVLIYIGLLGVATQSFMYYKKQSTLLEMYGDQWAMRYFCANAGHTTPVCSKANASFAEWVSFQEQRKSEE